MRASHLLRCATVACCLAIGACSSSHHATTPPASQPVDVPGTIASPGCQTATHPALTNARDSTQVGGGKREYLLTTPAAHTQPDPLVLDFHGYAEGDQTESLSTQFGALGQKDGFIVAFPNGTEAPIQWNTTTARDNPDLRFVGALLDHLEATECVDTARVYATGLSQGAFMTSTLACVMSTRFAAVAPVAGVELPTPCNTKRPVPILAFHGTADPILHFNGGIGIGVLNNALHARGTKNPHLPPVRLNGPGYPANVKAWAAKDGCRSTPTNTKLSAHVIHRVYPCPNHVAVEFDIVLGGGHSWPGSAFDKSIASVVGPTTSEIDATATIWSFFQHFHLSHPAGGSG